MTSDEAPAAGDTRLSTRRRVWAAVWLPGLAVAVGAAVATAHGLFEVALAARVPAGIAWIYPLITDGLALVAYAATARLAGSAARYAWSVVIVAAGLSGLAQASYLASDAASSAAGLTVSPALRFGVGAWPAIAAAVVAHLLYLLATDTHRLTVSDGRPVRPSAVSDALLQTGAPDRVLAVSTSSPASAGGSGVAATSTRQLELSVPATADRGAESPVRDRARAAATQYAARHGDLPTVRELMTLADASRGTAAEALKQIREQQSTPSLAPDAEPTDTSDPR